MQGIRKRSKELAGVGRLPWTVEEEPHYRETRAFAVQADKKGALESFLYPFFIKHRQHLYHVLLATSWMELLTYEEVWNSPNALLDSSSESNADAARVKRARKGRAQTYVAIYLTSLQRYMDSVHVLSELFEPDWHAADSWRQCGSLLCVVERVSQEAYDIKNANRGFWKSYPVREPPRNDRLLLQRIQRMVAFLGGEEQWADVRRNWEEGTVTAIGATYD